MDEQNADAVVVVPAPPWAGRLTPWKPGQSGNPKGRPPKPRELRDLDELIAKKHVPEVDRVLCKLRDQALKGNVKAAKEYMDRVIGKPKDADNDERLAVLLEKRLREMLEEAEKRALEPTP